MDWRKMSWLAMVAVPEVGAVRAEEADDFAARHGKADAADRFVAGVSLGKLIHFDHDFRAVDCGEIRACAVDAAGGAL
jgi:hypothetical protein